MRLVAGFWRRLDATSAWIGLGILAPLGMLVVSGTMLLNLRDDAWEKAQQTSRNLLQVIERDIARNIEVIDLALRGAVENLSAPGFAALGPELRQLILFDRAVTTRDMGVILVIDEAGNTLYDANAVPARQLNNADRSYFRIHRDHPDIGLDISEPVISRFLGVPVVVLSRRIAKPDGSFGGVVQASLKLTYFSSLFENLALGTKGAINLYRADGTRLVRYPPWDGTLGKSVADSPVFQHLVRVGHGSFVGPTIQNMGSRLHTFMRIGDLPLILDVTLAPEEIEAEWRGRAAVLGGVLLILCGLTAGLSLLFGRELRRRARMQEELVRLSRTDALTGLPNRRRFEEALAGIGGVGIGGVGIGEAGAVESMSPFPLSLLVIDADHFKALNDRYGHAVGDEVLKGLARCLEASVARAGDLVCRVGGEEFVVLLPGSDGLGAARVAARIHAAVGRLDLAVSGIAAGTLTVSIGVASSDDVEPGMWSLSDLYRAADAALYAAKADGRNQTRHADPSGGSAASDDAAFFERRTSTMLSDPDGAPASGSVARDRSREEGPFSGGSG